MCKKCFCFLYFDTSYAEMLWFLSDPSAVRPVCKSRQSCYHVPGWRVRKLSLPRPHPLQMLAGKQWYKTGRRSSDRCSSALRWHFRLLIGSSRFVWGESLLVGEELTWTEPITLSESRNCCVWGMGLFWADLGPNSGNQRTFSYLLLNPAGVVYFFVEF